MVQRPWTPSLFASGQHIPKAMLDRAVVVPVGSEHELQYARNRRLLIVGTHAKAMHSMRTRFEATCGIRRSMGCTSQVEKAC
eukprot:22845-Eustigmatos_ZCMA.PRE.1